MKRAQAVAWMKTQGTITGSHIVERILKDSGKYDESCIQEYLLWARKLSNPKRYKKTAGMPFMQYSNTSMLICNNVCEYTIL